VRGLAWILSSGADMEKASNEYKEFRQDMKNDGGGQPLFIGYEKPGHS
jgi:hypothetical protein